MSLKQIFCRHDWKIRDRSLMYPTSYDPYDVLAVVICSKCKKIKLVEYCDPVEHLRLLGLLDFEDSNKVIKKCGDKNERHNNSTA